jgi:hypothetical protein
VLIGMGEVACEALRRSGLGWCCTIERIPKLIKQSGRVGGLEVVTNPATEIERDGGSNATVI